MLSQWLSVLRWWLLLTCLLVGQAAYGALNFSSVTVNGGASTTVQPGASVTVVVNLTTTWGTRC